MSLRTTRLSVAAGGLSLLAGAATALTIEPHTPEALAAAQTAGAPVAMQFHAGARPARPRAADDLKTTPAAAL